MRDLTLLVLADVHLLEATEATPSSETRQCALGIELCRRAIRDARRRGGFDALVLLGDLLDAGHAPGAERDAAALERALTDAAGDVPRIVVPGNHDADADRLLSIFGDRPGAHEVGGYLLYTFADRWDEADVCRRAPETMQRFTDEAGSSGKPLIALQHNPLHPPIESDYPFMLTDAGRIMEAYSAAGVRMSLSAHYHPGQPVSECGGVRYYTAPGLTGSPFGYALVHLSGRDAVVEERALKLPEDVPLFDVHAHTHYAYCSADVTPAESIRRAHLFGLGGICLTEHADQLYLTREENAAAYVFEHGDYWCAPRSAESERMPRYRAEVEPLRDDYVRLGLEVELDRLGRPGVRPEHLEGLDLVVGAAHWIVGGAEGKSPEEVSRAFLESTETMLRSGVDVLGHPFRLFRRYKVERPKELYRPVAEMLARCGAAAEINFHTNEPDAEFFALCIEKGVKIALGSDSHNLLEVGDFHPHLALLREAAGRQDVRDLMFRDPWPDPQEGGERAADL